MTDQLRVPSTAPSRATLNIKVRVTRSPEAAAPRRPGLMARESLDAGAKNVFGIAYQVSKGPHDVSHDDQRASTATGTGPVAYPNTWVRLKRARGNVVHHVPQHRRVNWTSIGSVTISMNATLYVGMAVT